ncbi:unnamed protein product [Rangifer tarandus platyrhynchus]|uniref:Uncharacterized protein n=1 Tax=Rangifer tarandus platyrhynchus TaxID=3082113 RepID=A0AC59ZX53_RANTA
MLLGNADFSHLAVTLQCFSPRNTLFNNNKYMYTHTQVYAHIYLYYIYIYVCICMYIYISVYVYVYIYQFSSVQFSSRSQSCLTLCNPMNSSTPGLPVHHQLPEFTQTHVHQVSDAIQPSHPLSSPYPPTFNLSQHQGLFK